MPKLNPVDKHALEYVCNSNGGATVAHFVDDYEPIGKLLWFELAKQGWVYVADSGRIFLTVTGAKVLEEERG